MAGDITVELVFDRTVTRGVEREGWPMKEIKL